MDKRQLTSFGHWTLVKPLGSGAFGEVHQWINNIDGTEIATKRLKKTKLKQDEINILHKRWLQEYKWMQNLRTNFIVGAVNIKDKQFLNYLANQNGEEMSLPVITMEYCNGGDLRGHLNKINNLNGLQDYEVRNILFALLRATEYLHCECNIEHRDIKPENVVIHIKNNTKIYKLTDFGYAREIPESTIAQSVVGTRNYVAPEVIDSGIYTKTVDYWSIGIVTYEVICGIHPFIPHQTLFNRIKNIQQKPKDCISIVQNIDYLEFEIFDFINNIHHKNNMNNILLTEIEKWLRLALDTNYKSRGYDNNKQLKFYTECDQFLKKKYVSVFSLKKFKKYYYDIERYGNLKLFYQQICADNEIDINNIFFIFPPLHPKKFAQNPIDFFVPEWCDYINPDNPPVMLFVSEYLIQSTCDTSIENHFKITETIKKCINMSAEEENLENIIWILQLFERDVHFTLTESQHLLECYLLGLKYFAIEIDHAAHSYIYLESLFQRILQLNGSIKHSKVVVNEYINSKRGMDAKLAKEKAEHFDRTCQELDKMILPQLKITHKEILQKCRELALNDIFQKYAKSDVFEISKFRKFLSLNQSAAKRLESTQFTFEKCIKEFKEFTQSRELAKIRTDLLHQIQKFQVLRLKANEVNEIVERLESELENFSRSLIQHIINDKPTEVISLLHVDGPTPSNSLLNNHCSLANLEMDSQQLIDECESLCNCMEISLDIN